MWNVGQILRSEKTGEIGFFVGIEIPCTTQLVLKDSVIEFDVHEYKEIKDKNNRIISGGFVEENNLIGIYFGLLNEDGIKNIQENWDKYIGDIK